MKKCKKPMLFRALSYLANDDIIVTRITVPLSIYFIKAIKKKSEIGKKMITEKLGHSA